MTSARSDMVPPPPADEDEIAVAPTMPVQSAIFITPDGRVQFGALFEELLPVARALDPSFALPDEDSKG